MKEPKLFKGKTRTHIAEELIRKNEENIQLALAYEELREKHNTLVRLHNQLIDHVNGEAPATE